MGSDDHSLDRFERPNSGLLLIKVGTILSFVFPIITILVISSFPFPNPLTFGPEFIIYLFVGFIVASFAFEIISALFYRDIVQGNKNRITHELVLGILMFALGSNLAES
jgi:hypothetical protein